VNLPLVVVLGEPEVGDAQADQRLISRLIRQIAGHPPSGEQYASRSGLLVRLIRQHVVAEEMQVIPLLISRMAALRFRMSEAGYSPATTHDLGRAVTIPDPHLSDLPDPCSAGVHDWITKRNDDHESYDVCLRCGSQTAWSPLPPEAAELM